MTAAKHSLPKMPDGYRLRQPCKHCPFSPVDTRIRFACRERAEEIAESAYRNGFPCHESAVNIEIGEEETGFVFGNKTQHCAGAIMMFVTDGHDTWPGINNDEELVDRFRGYMKWSAPHYETEEEFLENAVEIRNVSRAASRIADGPRKKVGSPSGFARSTGK